MLKLPTISHREPRHGIVVGTGGEVYLPAVIEQARERARRRIVGFFTAEIRTPHTRRAYGSAVGRFLLVRGGPPPTMLYDPRHELVEPDEIERAKF